MKLFAVTTFMVGCCVATAAFAQPQNFTCAPLPGNTAASQPISCNVVNGQIDTASCACPANFVLVDIRPAPGAITLPPRNVSGG
jgi:hypothetical protein